MVYDFDSVIDRRETDSGKWRPFRHSDVLPMPVADMDFVSPPEVLEALHARVAHGVFGYSRPTEPVIEAIIAMLAREHGWAVDPQALIWLPGLELGLSAVCRLAEPGAAVTSLTPIYPPFLAAPGFMDRRLATTPMRETPGGYVIDEDRLSEDFKRQNTRLLLLCNPQNPTGRVFSADELRRLGAICAAHDVLICSDEIHCDLILDADRKHVPIATLSEDLRARTVTFMSPSKTYNLAGLKFAFAIVPDPELRRRFQHAVRGLAFDLSPFGYVAAEAAYRRCAGWRQALLAYLRVNRECVVRAVGALPGVAMNPIQATYLAWLDCRALGLADPAAHILERGRLFLSDGAKFGSPGFVRLNFGCPRQTLDEGLRRLATALAP